MYYILSVTFVFHFTVFRSSASLPVQAIGQTVAGATVKTTLTIGGNLLDAKLSYKLTDTIQVNIALNVNDSGGW